MRSRHWIIITLLVCATAIAITIICCVTSITEIQMSQDFYRELKSRPRVDPYGTAIPAEPNTTKPEPNKL
jgi:hypothetical protein